MGVLGKQSFWILAFTLACFNFTFVQSELVEIEIVAKVEQQKAINTNGAVYGAKPCDAQGKFIQWRFDVCNTTNSPCHIPDGVRVDGEFTFIPSKTVEMFGFKIILSINGSELRTIVDHPLKNSKMLGGIEQTIHVPGHVPEEYKNKGTILTKQKNILYRMDDKVVEMCVDAELLFW